MREVMKQREYPLCGLGSNLESESSRLFELGKVSRPPVWKEDTAAHRVLQTEVFQGRPA